jgi:hypothetical protein
VELTSTRGLVAARAAQATNIAKPLNANGYGQTSYSDRPYKRQKTGPVVTKFPQPVTGPVVTHYAPPPNQAPPYAATANRRYYPAPAQQHSQFAQNAPVQHGMPFTPVGPYQPTNVTPGYVHPGMSAGPQGYGPVMPQMQQPYGQKGAQFSSQPYGNQAPYSGSYQNTAYPSAQPPQQYGYNNPAQYSQYQTMGAPPQNYSTYHDPSPHQGPAPYQGQGQHQGQAQPFPSRYPGPLPVNAYPQSTPPYQQQNQNWGQPHVVPNAYPAPAFPQGSVQNQQSHPAQWQPPQHPSSHASPGYGNASTPYSAPTQFTVPNSNHQGFGPPIQPPLQPGFQNQPRSSSVSSSSHAAGAAVKEQVAPGKTAEELEFEWDLEKIFLELPHKPADPIAHPLPKEFDEEPILPPVYNATGITSKYVRPTNLEVYVRDVRLSLHWPTVRTDPVFRDINYNLPLVPLDQLDTWLQYQMDGDGMASFPHHETASLSPTSRKRPRSEVEEHEVEQHMGHSYETSLNSEPNDESQPSPVSPSILQSQSISGFKMVGTPALNRTDTPSLERSGTPSFGVDAEDDAWAPQPGEGQISTSPVEDPTEALLASLGVSGTPKPVSQTPGNFSLAPVCEE